MSRWLPTQSCLRRCVSAVLVSLALGGCVGGQTGQDSPYIPCPHEGKTPLATNQPSTLGFSADELLQSLPTPLGGSLHVYQPDLTDNLSFSLGSATAAREVVQNELPCRTTVEIEVIATLLTDDGLFNESVPVTLEALSTSSWRLQGERKVSELSGSYDWSVFPATQGQDPSLQVQLGTNNYGVAGSPAGPAVGTLWLLDAGVDPSGGSSSKAARIGDWMSAGGTSFGGGSGAGSGGSSGDGGSSGGGNGSLGGAGGTAGGVNSTSGSGGAGGA